MGLPQSMAGSILMAVVHRAVVASGAGAPGLARWRASDGDRVAVVASAGGDDRGRE